MAQNLGIWIDHKKAVIVAVAGDTHTVLEIESGVEKQARPAVGARGSTPHGPRMVASESQKNQPYKRQLRDYYVRVIRMIRDAGKIFIFGPGEAKLELERIMEKKKGLMDKIAGIEPATQLTETQIVAKVKRFYGVTSDEH